MTDISDPEFGTIVVRTVRNARAIRIRVAPNGRLSVTAPPYTPKFMIKRFINTSRDELRQLKESEQPDTVYDHGTQIGKSHTLLVKRGDHRTPRITVDGQQVILQLHDDTDVTSADVQQRIRDTVIKLLRVEAKHYLPRRLKFLADQGGYHYERVRFTHASSRWGSCSSTGTISLNIALMKLPTELIDYVLVHELAHTVQMNHSPAFWTEVARLEPHFRVHRRALKRQTPTI